MADALIQAIQRVGSKGRNMSNNDTNTYTARLKCINCKNTQSAVKIPTGTTVIKFTSIGACPICGVVGMLRIPLVGSEL